MKKYIFLLSLIFSLKSIAQQNRFIYLQTEGKQPFYVKLNKKILSSSSAGYLIIPKLTEGNYTLLLGFPKNEWTEQELNVTIQKNDLGFLVKNFNEKGGFIFSTNPLMDEIIKGVDPNEMHSGASLAMCLRQCQYKLRNMIQ